LLHNLLTNAVEALEGQPGGEISVTTRLGARGAEEVAEISVEDNGPGFQRELIGQVFDPYVTTKARGTGLGLAIVRKIVEEHGGHVEADNRAQGGARVRIELPLNESMQGQAVQRDARRPEPRRERA
jgi:nitrogen fixation/metabolism regulation signal transduction histidine kinase